LCFGVFSLRAVGSGAFDLGDRGVLDRLGDFTLGSRENPKGVKALKKKGLFPRAIVVFGFCLLVIN
jgi:hypothetical protein